MELRFKSGNSVPVERAYIKPEEWALVRQQLQVADGLIMLALKK
jgi:hypothetical protein